MLLDPETLGLLQRREQLLRSEALGEFADLVSAELFESLVEFLTPGCSDIGEVDRELCDRLVLAGPLMLVSPSGLGRAARHSGWALVLWPHLPDGFRFAAELGQPVDRVRSSRRCTCRS